MGRVLFALLLTLGVSTVSVHGSSRTKRQTDIECDEETDTQIITPFLFASDNNITNVTCEEKIAQFDDYYNMDYRLECYKWLKTEAVPDQVSETHVVECHDYGNGTIKYRTKVCCYGKPNVTEDQLICFTCDSDQMEHEPHIDYYHSQRCNHYGTGPEICQPGEVCSVELNYNASHYGMVSKSCMSFNDCLALEAENGNYCTTHRTPQCSFCYDTMYGNYDHLYPQPRVFIRPCLPQPCHYLGYCNETGEEIGDYECLCRDGFTGVHCEITKCHDYPCQNGGVCSARISAEPPYYLCRCHIPWTGYNCSEPAPLCTQNWCLNGGICYIQDGPDERCLCPDGFVGKSCEITRPGPEACPGQESQSRLYRRAWNYGSDAHDCTYWDTKAIDYLSYSNYQESCYSYLTATFNTGRPTYQVGVHGADAPNQDIWLYSCERGRDYTWITREICCASCGSNPCLNGGWCMQDATPPVDDSDDGYTCRCRFQYGGNQCQTKLKACYVIGDPHYYTFDGVKLSFQGACKYTLTENLAPATNGLPYFKVMGKNEHRGVSTVVTYPKYAEIEVFGYVIRLEKDLIVTVNGPQVTLPYEEGRFTISLNGRRVRLKTNFNLVVEFYRNWLITVLAPPDAAGDVDGMCRDYDDDVSNEFVLPNGTDVINDEYLRGNIIGNYFQVPDPEDSNCQPPPPPPVCDNATTAIIESTAYCGYIEDPSGPFDLCVLSVGQELIDVYMGNCIYDVCAVYIDGDAARKTAKCGSLAAFAEVCLYEEFPASTDWTTTAGCELDCPGDLVYNPFTTACLPTCTNPNYDEECLLTNTENCVCPEADHVALPNNTCVHASECGCYEEGVLIADRHIGDVWYKGFCTEKYTCVTCAECTRPVGIVSGPEAQFDPCDGVACEDGTEPQVDPSSEKCCTCCACDPKWKGSDCLTPRRYNCLNNNPCTHDNIHFYNDPARLLMYFAHDDPAKYIQCDPNSLTCNEIDCQTSAPPASIQLLFDPQSNVCNWPASLLPNPEGCVNLAALQCPGNLSECGCYAEGMQIGDEWYSDDCLSLHECVPCVGCKGKVETTSIDPCAGVQCANGVVCQVDPTSASCNYTCDANTCPCDPKWTGPNCATAKTYNCQNNNPCTSANIHFYNNPWEILMYFAHDDPGQFIQCHPFTFQCFEISCGVLAFDNVWNGCNWPALLMSNPNACP